MRYIPNLASNTIVQVPEDKNSYINVRNFGASGRGDIEFTGIVTDISSDGVVTIGNIRGAGNSISQYPDLFKQGTKIQSFGYRDTSIQDTGSITVSRHEITGDIDFSSSSATSTNLARLTYYVFGLNPETGFVPNHRVVYEIGTKIVSPDNWNSEQNINLIFSKSSQVILPVVFRSWGSSFKFLGVLGGNTIGYPGSDIYSFRDMGNLEIPGWENELQVPSFLSRLFSVSGGEVTMVNKLTSRESLTVLPNFLGSQQDYIQCEGLQASSRLLAGDEVIFSIDDTPAIQKAISLASSSRLKEVFFPAGVYNITDTFFSNTPSIDFSNITIRGVGDGSVISRLPLTESNASNPGLINFTGGTTQSTRLEGIRLRSMAFNGNRLQSFSTSSPLESEVTLQISNANSVVISDCTIFDNSGGGVYINNVDGLSLVNNKITRTGRSYESPTSPLTINVSENVVAQGNIIQFALSGPKIVSTDYSTINGNIIRGCGDQGIVLESSYQWSIQNNLAYNENDSIVQSIDTYNNEYSKATVEVRKGFSLDPIYMTVTYGGESVGIFKGSVKAKIFELDSNQIKLSTPLGFFKVLETSNQLEAGIFSLTLPGGTQNVISVPSGETILATGNLNNSNGYMYEVSGSVLIGKFRPFSIQKIVYNSVEYLGIQLRNSSDLLNFQIYSDTSSQNDRILIKNFQPNEQLNGWDQNKDYPIRGIDVDSNSILIDVSALPTLNSSVQFSGGTLSILRPNYFIADGNLLVHS